MSASGHYADIILIELIYHNGPSGLWYKKGVETMSVLELAKKYYPRLWNKERIQALLQAGKLTEAEAGEVLREEEAEA